MVDVPSDAIAGISPAEVGEVELYHPRSWWTRYVFSQDAKVIAIQYSITAMSIGLVALVLSWLMRLQLGFPGTFSFIDASQYLQFITMHGMIMVIYLLTALFLGGFGNYLIPLMVGARDMVFPYVNMLSYWIYLLAVLVLVSTFFVPGGPTGAGWTLYPPQAILSGSPGQEAGIVLMLVSLILFIIGFTMGGLNYVVTVLQGRTRGMTLMRMPLTVWGIFTATVMALLAFPALFTSRTKSWIRRLWSAAVSRARISSVAMRTACSVTSWRRRRRASSTSRWATSRTSVCMRSAIRRASSRARPFSRSAVSRA